MKSFRIIEIRSGEIAIALDGQTGIVPIEDVSSQDEKSALDTYVTAVAEKTTLPKELVREALKRYLKIQ